MVIVIFSALQVLEPIVGINTYMLYMNLNDV
jgi:hypothetical protein